MSIPKISQRGHQLHLALFFPFAPNYLWNETERNDIYYDFDAHVQLIKTAERGLFSTVFFGESLRLREHLGKVNVSAITGRPDALVLFAYLAAHTSNIGFVATLNTTYADPIDLARRIATVDVLTEGRAGWNVVTTDNAWTGANFRKGGYLPHRDRYRHAAEHIDAIQAIWDGWDAGTADYSGEFYDLATRSTVPPSPQAQPVFFQAGESDEGRDFAAKYAEGIFSRYIDFEPALAFAHDLGRRLVAAGRPADDVRIFPSAGVVLGDTDKEAHEKSVWLRDQIWTDRRILEVIEAVWGRDLSGTDVDGPLPEQGPTIIKQSRSHGVMNSRDEPQRIAASWRDLSTEHGYSIRELVHHLTASRSFVGTPSKVADELTRYVRAGAIDGLNLTADAFPHGLGDVVDRLVPELQERGVYPREYAGTTLRENLGLSAPVSRRRVADGVSA
ncbi:NtaA/DmoA family FMN-dependent monooxygenase [Cumulibacter soli]|uniref:NtaA/DmoA family FMN-dependent monooxygenase n=1 Tax=Cumulibacter soli TaxID=2546344 RepID=UPI001067EFC3|nr:NtaA/DmoA family FMN-dependent monooxygenase [Cumulibacter soli]